MTAFIPTRVFESCGPCCDVCPHCKRQAVAHRFIESNGYWVTTWRCIEHGDIPSPMRSAVVNRHPYIPDWSAA